MGDGDGDEDMVMEMKMEMEIRRGVGKRDEETRESIKL
jgi:hypothetical protein